MEHLIILAIGLTIYSIKRKAHRNTIKTDNLYTRNPLWDTNNCPYYE